MLSASSQSSPMKDVVLCHFVSFQAFFIFFPSLVALFAFIGFVLFSQLCPDIKVNLISIERKVMKTLILHTFFQPEHFIYCSQFFNTIKISILISNRLSKHAKIKEFTCVNVDFSCVKSGYIKLELFCAIEDFWRER